MISAALQRRVWAPPEHDRIYPNLYITLVGPPGTGKGGPIRAAGSIISEYKLKDFNPSKKLADGDNKYIAKTFEDKLLTDAQDEMSEGKSKTALQDEPLTIPIAADAVTYQALVQSMARCVRGIGYEKKMPDGTSRSAIYLHASQCFFLEEMASLFREHQRDLINFLIQAYDCSDVYEYRTKNQGRDRIMKMCLNFMAGTTPEFMQEAFDSSIIRNGYASRTFFIYAAKNRKEVFFRPELTEEQKQYRAEIAAHVRELCHLYGSIEIDQETKDWLQQWLTEFKNSPSKRAGKSAKMDGFYARINIHVMKVAMAMHFGQHTTKHVPLQTFKDAIQLIESEAVNMQYALTVGGDNPLSKTGVKIVEFLRKSGERNFKELLAQFWEDCPTGKSGLEEILQFLQQSGQITYYTKQVEGSAQGVIMYKVTGE